MFFYLTFTINDHCDVIAVTVYYQLLFLQLNCIRQMTVVHVQCSYLHSGCQCDSVESVVLGCYLQCV